MDFDLDQRTARLSVGELADFTLGPRDAVGGPSGLWRAQLGTHWHQQLRAQTASERSDALFEIPIAGRIVHRGWILSLAGRIDQLVPTPDALLLREIKTVTRELPADESELRAAYPAYFVQLATYAALARFDPSSFNLQPAALATLIPELHFVEVSSGLSQTVRLAPSDDSLFRSRLERVAEFLDLRLRSRERLRHLRFRPPFSALRPGQENAQTDLATALAAHPIVFFEAPTGFGKTGALLELALAQLRSGRFERLLYLTSKATGQLQVMRTLRTMTDPTTPAPASAPGAAAASPVSPPYSPLPPPLPVTAWLVRPKREHCVHTVYHCSRDVCPHLADLETRWIRSGLARFYLLENSPRDLESLRAAGRDASICPYEITRAALPFNDVWIGDYNYVFAPANRGLFLDQPGFDPARTLLVIDEAHNLPSRVADVHTHAFSSASADQLHNTLRRLRPLAQLVQAADHWAHFLRHLPAADALPLASEDDARHLLDTLAQAISTTAVDTTELGPDLAEVLWKIPSFVDELARVDVPRLWWSPRPGELLITCLDAARSIGPTLRGYGGVILASATLTPTGAFASACGLDTAPPSEPAPALEAPARLGQLTKRDTRRLYAQLTSASDLLKVAESLDSAAPALVRASAPWRDHAYDVAIDLRVDTSFQHRARHARDTAATIAALCAAARQGLNPPPPSASGSQLSALDSRLSAPPPPSAPPLSPPPPPPSASGSQLSTLDSRLPNPPCVAAFFPSYAYAESILRAVAEIAPELRLALQPRLPDLAAQTAWVETSLASADALLLVLGSSFTEGIDLLGGRISHAIVVGPALPEVNAVQRARLATFAHLGRDAAFNRVYRVPGIQKVNQALGRLVRSPGQRARVLLHCRRFAEPGYSALLAPEYLSLHHVESDAALAAWLHPEN